MKTSNLKNYFVNNKVILQDIIKPGGSTKVEFPYAEGFTGKEIEAVVAGCSCTADFSINKDKLTAQYRDETNPSIPDKYPTNSVTLSKSIHVYFKDGQPLKVKSGRGMVYNPNKEKVTLFFEPTVSNKS